ncbi:MAG: 50S ribosomal protein L24 [Promethearchaeota archaeon]
MKVNSRQPRKQRKALFNHKNHQRSKLNSCRLADFLQEEYGPKRLPLRVNDNVRVVRGEFKDFEGEVIEVLKNQRVRIKECTFEKTDGTQFHPAIHISNLIITKFRFPKKMDSWRAGIIERKAGFGEWAEGIIAPKKVKAEEVEKK